VRQPSIARAELFSYLVTRHTGRVVRTNIEKQLATFDDAVLAVLDLRNVELIDFSCADEIVAKLVVSGPPRVRRFFLFRGISPRHVEPIESALSRQGLVAAAETLAGDPLVLGHIAEEVAYAWRELWVLGAAFPQALAERLSLSREVASRLLAELDARALVIRDGGRYVSFGRALRDAPDEKLSAGSP